MMLGLSFGTVNAYSSVSQGLINAFEKELSKKTTAEQQSYLSLIENLFSNPNIKITSKNELIIKELKDWTQKRKLGPVSQSSTHFSDGQSYFIIANADAQKVREAWLAWHNDARAAQGLSPLNYHSDLEKTATAWSQYQVDNGYVGHKRSSTDSYYNYNKITERFSDFGVKFANIGSGKSAFSESMGYRWYACKSGDCTDALLTATKKSFDAFMKEGANGAHYKAIMMPHYTQMGIGFAHNPQNGMVYTTIHYGVDLVE